MVERILSKVFRRDMYGQLWVRDDAAAFVALAMFALLLLVAWVEGHTSMVAA